MATYTFALEVEQQDVSPDKRSVALAFDDHIIRLYSLTTGKLIHELKGHTDTIASLHFNSDGTQLVAGDWDDHVILWDVTSGKPIRKKNMGETVSSAYFSADDTHIILLVDEDPLQIFSPNLSKVQEIFPIADNLVASRDKRFFAGSRKSSVVVVDLKTMKQKSDIPIDSYDDEIFFSPNNKQLVIRDYSKFHTWDISENQKLTTMDIQFDIESATINPSKENEIFIYGEDVIEIWDYIAGKMLKEITLSDLNISDINHISISDDGKRGAISALLKDGTASVLILDLVTLKVQATIKPLSQVCHGSQFITEKTILLDSLYPIELWNIDDNRVIHRFDKSGSQKDASLKDIIKADFKAYVYGDSINGIDVNANGNIAITGSASPNTSMEIGAKGQLTAVYNTIYIHGNDTRYSHSGSLVAFAYHGEHLLLFDTKTEELQVEYDLGGVPSGTQIVKFSQDDKYLAAGSDDGSLDIIDVSAQKKIKNIQFYSDDSKKEESEGVFSLAWLSEDQLLVGTLEKLFLLDVKDGKLKVILDSGVVALDSFSTAESLKFVAVGRYEENILLLDKNLKIFKEIPDIAEGRIAISTDGIKVISLAPTEVHIWDIKNDSTISCAGPEEELHAMAYDAKNSRIYAGGDDGKVFSWDMEGNLLNGEPTDT